MVMQDLSARARALCLMTASAGVLFLAACSRQPSPDAYAEPPPPLPTQNELLGEGPSPPAAPGDFRAEAPPPYRSYDEGRYPPPPPVFEQGAAEPPRPPVVIAMEPIPNPPEPPPRERRTVRVYRGGEAPQSVTLPARRAEARREQARRAPPRQAPARPASARPVQAAPAKPAPAKITPPPQVAKAPPVKPTPPAQVAKVAPQAAKPAAPAPAAAAPAAKPPLVAPADRATKLAAMQSALTASLAKSAVLSAPERFTTGEPAAVTLTIPAEFADLVLAEAQKNGLSDLAASVNLNARLSGDGFAVTPSDPSARPLMPGEPTSFAWQVTARNGARGPLHVDMSADLNGAGSESLSLGALKTAGGGFRLTPRVIGATLLVLIAGIVVAWLARNRREAPRRPVQTSAAPPPPKPEPGPAAPAAPASEPAAGVHPIGANDHRDPS